MSEAREGVTVVTNDNIEQFIDDKIAETAPTEAPPIEEKKTEVVEPEVKAEEKTEEKKEDKPPKELKGLERRFHELTERNRAAEERATKEAERAAAAEAKAREFELKFNPPKTPEGQKPTPEQYTDINEYSEALEKWATENASKKTREEYEAKSREQEETRRAENFKTKFEQSKAELPDYDEVVSKSDVKVSDELRDAIRDSETPAHLIHYLAQNPDEAERIGKLTVGGMLREVGRLEARLKPSTKSEETTPKTEISKAPKPISTLKGGNAGTTVIDAKSDVELPFQDYKAKRLAGQIK